MPEEPKLACAEFERESTLVELLFLEEHPKRDEIEATVAMCIDRLLEITDGNKELVARIHARVGVILYYQCCNRENEKSDSAVPEEIDLAKTVEAIADFRDQLADSVLNEELRIDRSGSVRLKTAWKLKYDFGRLGHGRLLYRLQGQEGLLGEGAVTAENLVQLLYKHGESIRSSEKAFLALARDEGLPIEACRDQWEAEVSPEKFERDKDITVFMDYHFYDGHFWRGLARAFLSKSIKNFDREAVVELSELLKQFSDHFRGFFPRNIVDIPARIDRLQSDLDAVLSDGLNIEAARQFGRDHDLQDFGIVMKTWLDQQSAAGLIVKGRKDGKVAYFRSNS